MQFVLIMYGSAVLITELQKEYPKQDLTNLGQKTYEVMTTLLVFTVSWLAVTIEFWGVQGYSSIHIEIESNFW